jgi:hypothetical protein
MSHRKAYVANITRRKFLMTAAVLPLVAIIPLKALAATGQIHEIEGDVLINQTKINSASIIRNGDEIVVSKNGKLVFSMGEDAFLVRGGSTLQVYSEEGSAAISALRLVGGAMLGVFGKRKKATTRIFTVTATIGIRGTAVYAAVSPDKLYTCTCYGHTDLIVGLEKEDVIATHHNAHVVTTNSRGNSQMKAFEVVDHNDDELRMLEALVGRKPLFDS